MRKEIHVGRLSPRRHWTNVLTRYTVGVGGAAVIGAITLIFAYLLWVVAPILLPAEITAPTEYRVVERPAALVDVSENGEAMVRISETGIVEFFSVADGSGIAAYDLGSTIVKAKRLSPLVDTYALLDNNNNLLFVKTDYIVDFDGGQRRLSPKLSFPFSNRSIPLGPLDNFDVQLADDDLVIATVRGSQVSLTRFKNVEIGYRLSGSAQVTLASTVQAQEVFLGPRNQWIYLLSKSGEIDVLGIKSLQRVSRLYQGSLAPKGSTITAVTPVLGRYSLLTANDQGDIVQWGALVNANETRFVALRSFDVEQSVAQLITEPRRKGFLSVANDGELSLLYPTSGRLLDQRPSNLPASAPMAISPRSNLLIAAPHDGLITAHSLDNKHPEISWSALWTEVWYEGYEEPIFSWQSSSADNDFEPKFSLTPLAFGTMKAAFYALLFAVPIALMGAIYTAYFMAPAMRALVKPGIEIMAALPTVILGFLGGLWLAPIIEANLSSVLSIFVFMPLLLFAFALAWSLLPEKIVHSTSGWYGLIVTPLILGSVYLAFQFGPFFENTFFGGNSRAWFLEVLGLSYDQRNALVVGIIMGLAVIPTIFSIAEDAVYAVPTHLVRGSLALGATPWQTLVKVVLLTASPGIFSAVMIGMGRAVGETMIVLMATGNTPLMDFNIFEGMRTFAANIAVELPESEVDSSHYRILFLAALVLFLFTFVLNTVAEVVRQRLRRRYGSL
ncbi:MAG: ABC transporter permease subunit [Pseudomonadota bacterium]|nr:ABC transporter permease subunit [Pseudomonadota bacterium]